MVTPSMHVAVRYMSDGVHSQGKKITLKNLLCLVTFFKPMWHDLKLRCAAWVVARVLQRLGISLECNGNHTSRGGVVVKKHF